MLKAHFIFHGLFPDPPVMQQAGKRILARILFDAEFDGKFVSHLTADLYYIQSEDGEDELEINFDLPFSCPDFPNAVAAYYQQVMGPQSNSVSHSGPKGRSIIGHDVIRVEWHTSLPASSDQEYSMH